VRVSCASACGHSQSLTKRLFWGSGTGSGSLSRSFARVVAPHGHLYTFEFHAQRASANRDDFVNEGLGDLITVTHRDACAGGFKTEKLGESGIIATRG
jgi:tRNA (adenine57-N1/adenine58-N1)-methyltransferase